MRTTDVQQDPVSKVVMQPLRWGCQKWSENTFLVQIHTQIQGQLTLFMKTNLHALASSWGLLCSVRINLALGLVRSPPSHQSVPKSTEKPDALGGQSPGGSLGATSLVRVQ